MAGRKRGRSDNQIAAESSGSPRASPLRRRGGAIAIAALIGLGAAAALSACDGGHRFPVCKTNADCVPEEGKTTTPVCWNLKCVECRYDVDCPSGKACSGVNECVTIASSAPPDPPDAGRVEWDPGTWKQCAEGCKDQACLKKCSERFEQ
jgi:hypothetical protein